MIPMAVTGPGSASTKELRTIRNALEPLGGQFANLEGYAQIVTITATATPVGQLYNQPATITQLINFATIPAFQFAIFYNINLET